MRQGNPANQVALLLPTDDAWASFSPSKVSVTGAMQRLIPSTLMSAILSAGYNLDYIDADAINKVGINHQILVLPPTDRIPLVTLKKIQEFVAAGGKVISVGRVPSIDSEGKPQAAITDLASQLFNPAKSTFVANESELGAALHLAATPDFKLDDATTSVKDQVGFIRRRLPNADIYFVVNTSNQPIETTASFATKHNVAEQWNPDTATSATAMAKGQPIRLAPYESIVFVFSDSQAKIEPAGAEAPGTQLLDISSDWKVTFTGTGKLHAEQTLTDWIADPETMHYSGEAVYTRDFNLDAKPGGSVFLEVQGGKALPGAPNSQPEHAVLGANGLPNPLITRPGPGMHAYFDPPIHEAALVTFNGQPAGALWHPPYRLDVSRLVKSGQNHVEIHVFNTALNAWSAQPLHDYKPLIEKYGDRFQMQDLNRVQPISSGILGQVKLVTQQSE